MRRPRRRQGPSGDDRILPLINIVFLLLIFFMVAGTLSRSDPFEIAPPLSASDAEAPAGPPLVLMGRDGRLALDGRAMERAALLAALPARLANGAGELRLKLDARLPASRAVAMIAAFEAAGARRIRLLTEARR